jgi:hypothetical protein
MVIIPGLPSSIRCYYTAPEAGSTYGVFELIGISDNNVFVVNNINFYSTPKEITVTYDFNKQSATSDAMIDDSVVSNANLASSLHTQKFYFNQIEELDGQTHPKTDASGNPNASYFKYSMWGYTFMGFASDSTWSNASSWKIINPRVDDHSDTTWSRYNDFDIYSDIAENRQLYGRAFFSYNFYDDNKYDTSGGYWTNPTFVSHDTLYSVATDENGKKSYDFTYNYNFYNTLKESIHASMYEDTNVVLYEKKINVKNLYIGEREMAKIEID